MCFQVEFSASGISLSKGTYNFLILFVYFTFTLEVTLEECGPCSIKDVSSCVG